MESIAVDLVARAAGMDWWWEESLEGETAELIEEEKTRKWLEKKEDSR